MPLRHVPLPQSEFELHVPSGELAHLPLRQAAPPQSDLELQEPPRAVAHLPLRQDTPLPQSELELQPPAPTAHLPLRHEPLPQSECELHVPSGALAHLPLRQAAPPQSDLELHELPGAVAHLPPRQDTPRPQSELELHEPPDRAQATVAQATVTPTVSVVAARTSRVRVLRRVSVRLVGMSPLVGWARAAEGVQAVTLATCASGFGPSRRSWTVPAWAKASERKDPAAVHVVVTAAETAGLDHRFVHDGRSGSLANTRP